jgi:nitrogen regulatory protein P-II 1
MKLITAFLHHIRVGAVVDALSDAGFRHFVLQDVRGTLQPLEEAERVYSSAISLVISEAKLSLVCEEAQVSLITSIIRVSGSIGADISGWVYVSPIDQALPIGGVAV